MRERLRQRRERRYCVRTLQQDRNINDSVIDMVRQMSDQAFGSGDLVFGRGVHALIHGVEGIGI
jgi:hypothetical protein